MGFLARWRRWVGDRLDGWAWERVGRQVGEQKRDEEQREGAGD